MALMINAYLHLLSAAPVFVAVDSFPSVPAHRRASELCGYFVGTEITQFVRNGHRIVTGSSEMNPLEMLENEDEPQTMLISNPRGNLESLTTICAFENSKFAHFYE